MASVKDTVNSSPPVIEQTLDDRPVWEIILESGPDISLEERANAPRDGARNDKHYLYGHSKEETIKA